MTWLLIAYLFALLYVSTRRDRTFDCTSLRLAWMLFAAIPISHFVFALFRAGNIRDTRDLALVEIWSDGFVWLLLGISLYFLAGAVVPKRAEHLAPPPPPPPPG